MIFFNLLLFFTTSMLQSVPIRSRQKPAHTLDTVSKPMFHKYVIQMT